jgi:hypothetical protein
MDADPPDPVSAGQRVSGAVTFDVPEDVRRVFTIRFASVDDAGNRSLYDRRVRFTIDRELPDDPQVSGAPEGGVSDRPVTLALSAGAAAASAVYELTDDGSMPRLPTASSTAYASPLLLAGRAGAQVTYRLLPRAFDDLGNASRAGALTTVVIDRTVPAPPSLPRVTWSSENAGTAYFAWDPPPVGRLFYRVRAGILPAGDFLPYDGPVAVTLTPEGSTITVDAVVRNNAGTTSALATLARVFPGHLPAPTFRGARDGGIYSQRVDLRPDASTGSVRYSISSDGSFPPAVTASSAQFPSSLALDAADGQTVEWKIAARVFDPSGVAQPSPETFLDVTVDRTPPDPPTLEGVDDGGYYQDTRHISLLAPEGVIYYGVSTDGRSFMPAQVEANRYAGEISLDVASGQAIHYRVVAYTVDAAGNRSRETRSWSFTIDQATVYATPTGNDYADGSRDAPVRSVSRAMALAGGSSRKTVFLAAGDYALNEEVVLPPGVTVAGGMDPSAWTPLGLERLSVITAASPWKTGLSLLSLAEGTATLKGIEVRGASSPAASAGGSSLAALVSVSGGTLTLDMVTVSILDSARMQGIVAAGGAVVLTNSRLRAGRLGVGALLASTGGAIDAEGSAFEGASDAEDFAAVDIADADVVVLKGLTITPGSGQRTRGIRSLRSHVTVSGGTIGSGSGTLEAFGVDAMQSTLSMENTAVVTLSTARTPAGILATQSVIAIEHGTITLSGGASASAIAVRGGELSFLRSTIRAATLREYASLIRVEDAKALISNNVLWSGDAGQTVGISLKGGSVDVLNNSIVAATGSTTTIGILIQGDAMPRVVNNIFARPGAARGTAVAVIGARRDPFAPRPAARPLVLLTNSFSGWQQVLRVDFAPDLGREPLVATGAPEVNDADQDSFSGSSAGNIATEFAAIFKAPGDYRVTKGWNGLDAGTDLTAPKGLAGTGSVMSLGGADIQQDFAGRPRPAPQPLKSPGPPRGWDIGADEFSE